MEFVSQQYQALRRKSFFVHETVPDKYHTRKIFPIAERVVRCAWYDQRIIKENLKTITGAPITVLSQGEWNLGGGPDFTDALIQFGDAEPVRGAVEIHVRSSDWKRHRHTADEAYRDVILNVSLWHDDIEPDAYNDLDQPIPHVELCGCLDTAPEELASSLDLENYPFSSASRVGKCCKAAKGREVSLMNMLEIAGQERLYFKANRLWRELENTSFTEALYRCVMESMGYKPNKKPFRALAAMIPAETVRGIESAAPPERRAEALQSIFFAASGLFSNIQISADDDETREYCENLRAQWQSHSAGLRINPLTKKDWHIHGVRPANFPLRRMAGVSQLLARISISGLENIVSSLAADVKAAAGPKEYRALLSRYAGYIEQPAEGYWAHRITPGGNFVENAPALIGKTMGVSVLINVFFPALMCRARLDGDEPLRDAVIALYGASPALDEHQITRLMRYRIRGEAPGGAVPLGREIIQQGLLQVFFDFCDGYIRDCSSCPVPELIAGGPELKLDFTY